MSYIVKKIEMHSSCEIEDFVATNLCKLCDTPRRKTLVLGGGYRRRISRSRVSRVVCPHLIQG